MELLWQNGQVVMQNQNQRPFRKQPPTTDGDGPIPAREIRSSEAENYNSQHLFMQEDEMASWLHYPIHEDPPPFDHHDFCADILYPPPNATASQNRGSAAVQSSFRTTELWHPAPRPPIPPPRRPEHAPSRIHNFAHFTKHGNASSSSKAAAAAQPTVVDSCETPVATAEHAETGRARAAAGKTAVSDGGRETATCDVTVTSSPGDSSGSAEPVEREPMADRKRKGREHEESEFQSEVSESLSRLSSYFIYFWFHAMYHTHNTFHISWCWLSCTGGVTCLHEHTPLHSIQRLCLNFSII